MERPKFRKPVPEGVIEHINLGINTIVEMKDGSLLADNGRVSGDGGKTWSEPRSFGEGVGGNGEGIIRLKSGALAMTSVRRMWLSTDEGKTWSGERQVFPSIEPLLKAYGLGDEMIQLDSGRLLCPIYLSFRGEHSDLKEDQKMVYGTWRGQRIELESHGHVPEIYITYVAYSDDEGETWRVGDGNGSQKGRPSALMGWFDEEGKVTGHRGVTGVGEATVAETTDGRILLFARPTVNRVVHSYSADGGETWSAVLPTELANSISPARLTRIPKTGDLMCVWNQMSREEIQRGYRRGRLSAAISRDSGATWENFKTLELSAGLDDVDRIPPEYPIKMTRAREDAGQLPDDWAYFHYANVKFAKDNVFIIYPRGTPSLGIAERNLQLQELVLRVYPLDWFYK